MERLTLWSTRWCTKITNMEIITTLTIMISVRMSRIGIKIQRRPSRGPLIIYIWKHISQWITSDTMILYMFLKLQNLEVNFIVAYHGALALASRNFITLACEEHFVLLVAADFILWAFEVFSLLYKTTSGNNDWNS